MPQINSLDEKECKAYLKAVLGVNLKDESLFSLLKDGQLLCLLINTISPLNPIKISNLKSPFKQMENIANFLLKLKLLNIPDCFSFQTVDLFEDKNMHQVGIAIFALSRHAHELGFPLVGPKRAVQNKRTFSDHQISESKAAVPLLTGGLKIENGRVSNSKFGKRDAEKLEGVVVEEGEFHVVQKETDLKVAKGDEISVIALVKDVVQEETDLKVAKGDEITVIAPVKDVVQEEFTDIAPVKDLKQTESKTDQDDEITGIALVKDIVQTETEPILARYDDTIDIAPVKDVEDELIDIKPYHPESNVDKKDETTVIATDKDLEDQKVLSTNPKELSEMTAFVSVNDFKDPSNLEIPTNKTNLFNVDRTDEDSISAHYSELDMDDQGEKVNSLEVPPVFETMDEKLERLLKIMQAEDFEE